MIDPIGFNMYYCAASVRMGKGTVVWQFASIMPGVKIGANCVIGSGCWIGDDTVIGDDARLQHGVFIPRRSRIGSRVFIGPLVCLTDDKHPRVGNTGYTAEPPVLEDDCSIGAGAVILPGVTIGHHATVGAGAVVSRDVPPYETVVGVPAYPLVPTVASTTLWPYQTPYRNNTGDPLPPYTVTTSNAGPSNP